MMNFKLILVALAALGLAGVLASMQMATAQVQVKPSGSDAMIMSCPSGWAKVPGSIGYSCQYNYQALCAKGMTGTQPTIKQQSGTTTFIVSYNCTKMP